MRGIGLRGCCRVRESVRAVIPVSAGDLLSLRASCFLRALYFRIEVCNAATYSAKASRPVSVMRQTVQGILPRKVFSISM